jgi:hypothetical protein
MAVSWEQQNTECLSMTHIIHNTSALKSITIAICFKSLMQTFSQQMALFPKAL